MPTRLTAKEKKYRCPYCSTDYLDKWDAEECATDCIAKDVEDVIVLDTILSEVWVCNICKKEFSDDDSWHDNKKEAQKCEDRHIDAQDIALGQYQFEQNRTILDMAAQHSEQRKITNVQEN